MLSHAASLLAARSTFAQLSALHQFVGRHYHQLQQQPQQHHQEQHNHHLARLIQDNFPPVSYGFAYGSGVFVQPDLYAPNAPKGSGPMLDFILAVNSPQEWHAQVQCTQCGAGGGG